MSKNGRACAWPLSTRRTRPERSSTNRRLGSPGAPVTYTGSRKLATGTSRTAAPLTATAPVAARDAAGDAPGDLLAGAPCVSVRGAPEPAPQAAAKRPLRLRLL